jgi:drug/metabolite transporter (DMT)-like permease
MRLYDVSLVLVSVALSSGSQVMLKLGMMQPSTQRVIFDGGTIPQIASAIATSPLVIVGLACFGLSAVFWLFVLARLSLSTAYPFVALGIVLTLLASHFIVAEVISPIKLAGAGAIVLGVFMIGVAG